MLHLFFRLYDRIPAWLRPAAAGAVVVLVLTAGRVLLLLPTFFKRPDALLDGLRLAAGASLMGAVAGLAYSLVGKPLRRVPAVGPYLAGVVTVGAYLVVLAVFAIQSGEKSDAGFWVVIGGCAVVFGAIVGHKLFRDDVEPPAP